MDAPLISVIVPVYKVEAYLDRCVQSIVDQTYTNLEIVLVDDGSPDNCGAMCDAWAEKDSRIRVIHQENGGLSAARNAGLAVATGDLIGFVDSDDYVSGDMYQLLWENMKTEGSDIAVCGVQMVYDDGTLGQPFTKEGCCVLRGEEVLRASIEESWLKHTVWNRLYKRSVIHGILFPEGKYHEDVFWSWQAVARAGKISVFDTPCYFYTQRANSIMGSDYSLRRLDALEAKVERQAYLEKECSQLASLGRWDLLFSCMYHGQQVQKWLAEEEKSVVMVNLRQIARACSLPKWSQQNKMRVTHCIWMALAKWNLPMVCRIRNVLKIGV